MAGLTRVLVVVLALAALAFLVGLNSISDVTVAQPHQVSKPHLPEDEAAAGALIMVAGGADKLSAVLEKPPRRAAKNATQSIDTASPSVTGQMTVTSPTTATPREDDGPLVVVLSDEQKKGKWGFHTDAPNKKCDKWVNEELIEHWKSGRRDVCTPPQDGIITLPSGMSFDRMPAALQKKKLNDGNRVGHAGFEGVVVRTQPRVVEWRLSNYSYNTQVRELQDVVLVGGPWGNPEMLNCTQADAYFHHEDGHHPRAWLLPKGQPAPWPSPPVTEVIYDRVLIRIHRFDMNNPYESFHAFMNIYVMMRVFKLDPKDVQFILIDGKARVTMDESFWRAMSGNNHEPVYGREGAGPSSTRVLARHVLDAPSAGTSLICTHVGPMHGRGADHHCKSRMMRDGTDFIRAAFNVPLPSFYHNIAAPSVPPSPIRVLFCARRPFTNGDGTFVRVRRALNDEKGFVIMLGRALGSGYHVSAADFSQMTARESIEATTNAHIVVGVHGAGLMWAAYLPRHGMIVEMFGGDRGSNNRHYHNIASLSDLHYAEHSLNSHGHSLSWGDHDVQRVAELIKSYTVLTAAEPS